MFHNLLRVLLFIWTTQATAWWGVPAPYYQAPYTGYGYPGYYPAWPGTLANNPDWRMHGTVNEWGDVHFVMEYHGNIYGGSSHPWSYGNWPRQGYSYGWPQW